MKKKKADLNYITATERGLLGNCEHTVWLDVEQHGEGHVTRPIETLIISGARVDTLVVLLHAPEVHAHRGPLPDLQEGRWGLNRAGQRQRAARSPCAT